MKRSKMKRLANVTTATDVDDFPRGKIILFSVRRITTRKRRSIYAAAIVVAATTVVAVAVPIAMAVLIAINTNLKLEKTSRHQMNMNTAKAVAPGMMLLVG